MSLVNLREWWENYFANQWDANGGPAQTRHFMERLLANLPASVMSYLGSRALRILDWGCAFGDGVEVLSKAFPQSMVSGLDFATTAVEEARRRYPHLSFLQVHTGEIPGNFDVIITSNCLEHFSDPLTVMQNHLRSCRKLYICLVPFEEAFPLHEQHCVQFTKATFPERLNGFIRICSEVIDVDPLYWPGKQLLVVYASPEYLEEQIGELIREKESTIDALRADLVSRDELISTLRMELVSREELLGRLRMQLAEREQQVHAVNAELATITSSRGWKLLCILWRFRVVIIPRGSLRERLLRLCLMWVRAVRQKGFNFLVHKGYRKTRALLGLTAFRVLRSPKGRRAVQKLIPYIVKRHLRNLYKPSQPLTRHDSELASSVVWARLSKTSTYDILCFPIIDWHFRYQRPQHLCSYYAKRGHRIFYLNPNFSLGSVKPSVACIKNLIFDVRLPSRKDISIYQDSIDDESLEAVFLSLLNVIEECEIAEAVCIVQLPFWRPLAEKIREHFGWKIIYDCMDEHSGFSTNNEKMLYEEKALVQNADLVVVTSRKLYASKKQLNGRCILVPNATDFDHFSVAFGSVPNVITNLPRPVIGYYGAISEWFDVDLVFNVAKDKPQWSFVLIGHTFGSDCSKLFDLPNVHLLGEQPYAVLPTYLHQFDVCIIPFKLNALTEATNPVKFFEYLSAGKPVVSVPLPELQPYEKLGLVSLAGSPMAFTQCIEKALLEDTEHAIYSRITFAWRNTWERRFNKLYHAINDLYPLVSIIIVTHNNVHLTKLCIESINNNTLRPNVEVIIVDNGSTDETTSYLNSIRNTMTNVRVIFNEENLGFAAANNIGIKAAHGDYIVLLNNDTIVTRGWLTQLLKYLDKLPESGMVGPVTNCIGNEAQIDANYHTLQEMEYFAKRYTSRRRGQFSELKNLAMFCIAMRKNLIDRVGLLDERFEVGMFEDDDYSMRVRNEGLRLVCAEDVFIHHFGGSSFAKLDREEYEILFAKNRRRFEEKWSRKWEPHSYRGDDFRTHSLFDKKAGEVTRPW